MKLSHIAALALVGRYRLMRAEMDAELIILMVGLCPFRYSGMVFQMVANRTRQLFRAVAPLLRVC